MHDVPARRDGIGHQENTDTGPVVGLMWWHDCPHGLGWLTAEPYPDGSQVLTCPACGDSGRIVAGAWVATEP